MAFALFEASYYAEIIRAGIQSVSGGQVSASLALGMTGGQTMRLIVLPQAFRRMIPLLLTQAIILFQDTSLVYVIGLAEFFGVAYNTGNRDGTLVELLLFAGAVYFVICFGCLHARSRAPKEICVMIVDKKYFQVVRGIPCSQAVQHRSQQR